MPLFTSEQLARYEQRAEELFVKDHKCLIDRICLPIQVGVAVYTLPDQCMDIRRITYRGIKLDPMAHRELRTKYDGLDPQGRPYAYIYNLIGALKIRLWPAPSEVLTPVDENLFSPTVIQSQCIVEYYAIPDGIGFKLPDYMRRRLLKAYVLSQAYAAEGKGQNLKAATYWKNKWIYLKETYATVLHDLYERPRKLVASNIERYPVVPRPVLPLKLIGIGVDDDSE